MLNKMSKIIIGLIILLSTNTIIANAQNIDQIGFKNFSENPLAEFTTVYLNDTNKDHTFDYKVKVDEKDFANFNNIKCCAFTIQNLPQNSNKVELTLTTHLNDNYNTVLTRTYLTKTKQNSPQFYTLKPVRIVSPLASVDMLGSKSLFKVDFNSQGIEDNYQNTQIIKSKAYNVRVRYGLIKDYLVLKNQTSPDFTVTGLEQDGRKITVEIESIPIDNQNGVLGRTEHYTFKTNKINTPIEDEVTIVNGTTYPFTSNIQSLGKIEFQPYYTQALLRTQPRFYHKASELFRLYKYDYDGNIDLIGVSESRTHFLIAIDKEINGEKKKILAWTATWLYNLPKFNISNIIKIDDSVLPQPEDQPIFTIK